jgi:hypothetical protein
MSIQHASTRRKLFEALPDRFLTRPLPHIHVIAASAVA